MIVTPQETFLTLAEAAEALACDPETVRKLAAEGKIVGRKPGRAWVFTASSLAAYLHAGEPAGKKKWRSTSGGRRGTVISRSPTDELGARLALIHAPKLSDANGS